ncbi:cysteine peptidase family C39 domain-containing protein, partial [Calothrix rhizosoleniae]|uniref:cysteine peptidase family C39 domain-containing protein n=1 Tax=Calothrix rhizosoleniae TaxID=888997 RepID=UPI001F327038
MVISKQNLNQQLNRSFKNIVSGEKLEKWSHKLQIIEPKPGELFWESQTAETGVYLILEGKVRLLDNDNNLIFSLSVGWFGQITLFPEANLQPYSIRASLGLKVGYLDRSNLESLLTENQQLVAIFHRQAIELDLLLLHQQNQNHSEVANRDIFSFLPLLKEHHLTAGSLPDSLLQNKELWLLRQGEILHSSGQKLTPGNLYEIEQLPQTGEWLISQPTELYSLDSQEGQIDLLPPVTNNKQLPLKKLARIPPQQTKQEKSQTKEKEPPLYFPNPRVKITHWWQNWSKRYPFHKQHSASDCGVACLVMVGKYWGKNFGTNQLRSIANVDRAGTSIKGLITAAEFLGFIVRPRKADLPALAHQELPAIAHWEGNHYIVVYQITKKHVIVCDPQIGRRILTRQEFVAGWSGYVVFLTPTAKFKQAEEAKQDLWKYTTLLQPYWLVLLEVFVTSLMIQIVGLFSPIFTQV